MKDLGPIKFCAKCRHMSIRMADGYGIMLCDLDGQRVQKHVDELNCGLGHFKAGIGDLLKRLLVRSGIDGLWKLWINRPCGCDKRRRELNSRWDEFFAWMDGWSWKRLTYCPCEDV